MRSTTINLTIKILFPDLNVILERDRERETDRQTQREREREKKGEKERFLLNSMDL